MSVRAQEVDILQGGIKFIPGQDPVVELQDAPIWSLAKICKSWIRIGDEVAFRGICGPLEPEADRANDQRGSEGAENRGLLQAAWHSDK